MIVINKLNKNLRCDMCDKEIPIGERAIFVVKEINGVPRINRYYSILQVFCWKCSDFCVSQQLKQYDNII